MSAELPLLLAAQSRAVHTSHYIREVHDADLENFNDIDVTLDPNRLNRPKIPAIEVILPPKRLLIAMPSNCLPEGHPLCEVELSLQIKQAFQYLDALREAIADKYFLFSHVIREAPTKRVCTRARAKVRKHNDRIAMYARIYNKCWSTMVHLGADPDILLKFRSLVRDDLKASTAILAPNRRGASTFHLSWIWQTGTDVLPQSAESLRECQLIVIFDSSD